MWANELIKGIKNKDGGRETLKQLIKFTTFVVWPTLVIKLSYI